ncbi:hypothetical protein FOA52_000985 [Chlamydomonas sp. UWO 241]|nr:hypothetical protein FOA52_000985 [Chlamydomonas sp. UWO 241]
MLSFVQVHGLASGDGGGSSGGGGGGGSMRGSAASTPRRLGLPPTPLGGGAAGGGASRGGGAAGGATPPPYPPALSREGSASGLLSAYAAAHAAAPPPPPPLPPHPRSGRSSHTNVAVRLRPLSERERARGDRAVWSIDGAGNVGSVDARSGRFTPKYHYDATFGPECCNADVYGSVAAHLIAPALDGVSGTIFAYGVTSSGKTHTMSGCPGDWGVVPCVVRDLFQALGELQASGAVTGAIVKISMMEIYNEALNDLLDLRRTNLKVLEDRKSGLVVVEGLSEDGVASAAQALAVVGRGERQRKVAATSFNEDSSRSHTICRLNVEIHRGGAVTSSVLSLVDLAGSESAKATSTAGRRMEGSFINKSLLTLSTVINRLSQGRRGEHVPFRDSKLTRLLQSSMSGPGALLSIVCTITPASAQSDETANTLKFATRAKLVAVTASRNKTLDDAAIVRRLRAEITDLKRQVALLMENENEKAALPEPRSPGSGES